jgi:hypothetical protein
MGARFAEGFLEGWESGNRTAGIAVLAAYRLDANQCREALFTLDTLICSQARPAIVIGCSHCSTGAREPIS